VLLSLGGAVLLGGPLRAASPRSNGPEMQEVRALWAWLRTHHVPDPGRTYLQDTFYTRPLSRDLALSHVLSLTAHEAGVSQVGPYYGVAPYGTQRWLLGEFGRLFGRGVGTAEDARAIADEMVRFGCDRLVLADPALREFFEGLSEFKQVYQSERFTVLELAGAPTSMAVAGTGVSILSLRLEPGEIRVAGVSDQPDGELGVKEAWHPFWHLDAPPGVELTTDGASLMRVRHIPRGRFQWTVRYRPPTWPLLISLNAWLVMASVAAFAGRTPSGSVVEARSG
jgi:hypothetical protein